jgi:chromosome partitioning protein
MNTRLPSSFLPSSSKTTDQQVILWIGANSGGVSKTTIAVHVGYEMAKRGYDVALLDLDTNVSMNQFCGLEPADPDPEQTMAAVFDESFDGNWPLLTPEWGTPNGKFQVCQGGPVMIEVSLALSVRNRREYVLSDLMADHPLPHQVIILDCPATLGNLSDIALAAATHMLIPVGMTPKSLRGSSVLLDWYRATCRKLRLNPIPEILGFVPTLYDKESAIQRDLLAHMPNMLNPIGIKCYPQMRYSSEFINASDRGMPLQIHRKNHKACQDLQPICDDLSALLEAK